MFCSAVDASTSTFGCAPEGAVRATDGARTNVADVTAMSYYQGNAGNCGAGPDCDYRRGNLASVVNALGHSTRMIRYDRAGQLLESTFDGSNPATDDDIGTINTYSPRGWLMSTSGASASGPSPTRSFEYDPVGNLTRAYAGPFWPDNNCQTFAASVLNACRAPNQSNPNTQPNLSQCMSCMRAFGSQSGLCQIACRVP